MSAISKREFGRRCSKKYVGLGEMFEAMMINLTGHLTNYKSGFLNYTVEIVWVATNPPQLVTFKQKKKKTSRHRLIAPTFKKRNAFHDYTSFYNFYFYFYKTSFYLYL